MLEDQYYNYLNSRSWLASSFFCQFFIFWLKSIAVQVFEYFHEE